MRSHEEVYGKAGRVDHCLTRVQRREGMLDVYGVAAHILDQLSIPIFLQLLIVEGLHRLIVHDTLVQIKLRLLIAVLPGPNLLAALNRHTPRIVGVQAQSNKHVGQVL